MSRFFSIFFEVEYGIFNKICQIDYFCTLKTLIRITNYYTGLDSGHIAFIARPRWVRERGIVVRGIRTRCNLAPSILFNILVEYQQPGRTEL